MTDYLEIGTAPADENCVQVGEPDYANRALQECQRFVALLEKKFPVYCAEKYETINPRFVVKKFPHDFGNYFQVCIEWDDKDGEDFAFWVEENLPETWED